MPSSSSSKRSALPSLSPIQDSIVAALAAALSVEGPRGPLVEAATLKLYELMELRVPSGKSRSATRKKSSGPRKESPLDLYKKKNKAKLEKRLRKKAKAGKTVKSAKTGKSLVILTKNGHVNMTTFSSYASQQWQKLSPEDRAVYEQQSMKTVVPPPAPSDSSDAGMLADAVVIQGADNIAPSADDNDNDTDDDNDGADDAGSWGGDDANSQGTDAESSDSDED